MTTIANLLVRAPELPDFRRELDMETNPVCKRCVCTIRPGGSPRR